MIDISTTISLVFFLLAFIYLFIGIDIAKIKLKSHTNKIFFLICISLSIWSLGFSMEFSSKNVQAALFWRRISAIGWTTMYAFILHFIILLTKKNSILEKSSIFTIVFYLPLIINIYIFSISNTLTARQYNLVKSTFGWIDVSKNNIFDWFFYLYYGLYIIITAVMLWKWQEKLKHKKNNKDSTIFKSVIFSFLIGIFSYVLILWNSRQNLSQSSPLFMFFLMSAIY